MVEIVNLIYTELVKSPKCTLPLLFP